MLLIFLLIIVLAGCNNYNQYELEVVMPHLPDHIKSYYGNVKFELKYPDSNGDNYAEITPGSSVFICSAFSVFPILATPYVYFDTNNLNGKENITLYPAGAIFPESGKEGKLFLTWEDGFAAEIIYRMVNNGYNIDSFNLSRFKNYLIEKSSGNPWVFDEENIIYALSFDIFNANFVKKINTHEIMLQIPSAWDKKKWMLSNLSDYRFFEEENGTLILDNMPERNVYILSDTGKEFIELFMDTNGWNAYFSDFKEILSGRW